LRAPNFFAYRKACDYNHQLPAHSPLIGWALDGFGIYGLYEAHADGAQEKPTDLDACNGHAHAVPANATYGITGNAEVCNLHNA
jgi:hypothetical protein